jgi:uncharacterized protein (DUF305 family)
VAEGTKKAGAREARDLMTSTDSPPAPAPGLAPPRRWLPPAAAAVVVAVAAGVLAGRLTAPTPEPAPVPAPAGPVLDVDPVDLGFATDMLDHHQQALQMGLLAEDKATTTPVKALAVKMVAGQQMESGRFIQYLEERGRHQGDPDREVMGWMGMPLPRDRMPGLASPAEMLALTNATGGEVDRLFLDLMLRHHEGGLHMAEFAHEHGRNEPLKDLAGRMVVMQRREIADMTSLRAGLG